jgi:cytochrome P450
MHDNPAICFPSCFPVIHNHNYTNYSIWLHKTANRGIRSRVRQLIMKLLSILTTFILAPDNSYTHPFRFLLTIIWIYALCWIVPQSIAKYMRARRTGLKIILSPITPYTLTWRLASSLFGHLLKRWKWYRAIDWTCCWQDGDLLHAELGESFLVVSPGLTVLCTSDATTYEAVLKEWREYEKPGNVNEILGTFGRNVDTSNGGDWPRHRKIVAPCFSERASGRVWDEALRGAEGLVEEWLKMDDDKGDMDVDVVEGMSTLALNVISAVAFENHQVNGVVKGHTLSLRAALTTVMSTSVPPALEGLMSWLNAPALRILVPTKIQSLVIAMKEFRQYMDELIVRERQRSETEKEVEKSELNLIQTLIRANTVQETKLSDTELRGNIFIFTVGGLESTSATLTYALALLSIHPKVQDWVVEEISQLSQAVDVEYTKIFPKLTKVKAIMVRPFIAFPYIHLTRCSSKLFASTHPLRLYREPSTVLTLSL